ncbi:Pr6Pr family membrane protein [Mycolicibacterium hippocampi]|uniref:Pr6Pr family membrane protein n=1 Tax=Mycolicibacterium hippocampi TaxID=659824 RepID=UPI003510DCDF
MFIGVTCQFLQKTDPRFPLVYFTVWSGILAGVIAIAGVRRYSRLELPRVSAAVGVVVSGVIFAVVIAPATATGTWFQPWDDLAVRIANVLLHGVAPVLVVTDLILRPPTQRLSRWLGAAYGWPMLYFIAIATSAMAVPYAMPYAFLSPQDVGWPTVLGAVAASIALFTVVALVLFLAAKRSRRRRRG